MCDDVAVAVAVVAPQLELVSAPVLLYLQVQSRMMLRPRLGLVVANVCPVGGNFAVGCAALAVVNPRCPDFCGDVDSNGVAAQVVGPAGAAFAVQVAYPVSAFVAAAPLMMHCLCWTTKST